MSASFASADVYTDFSGLAELRGQARNSQNEETLREVAGQFEALFIQMMLKSMRDASLGEGLLDSQQSKTYQSMFDQQIALDMSKHQGLGLAEVLVRQLRKGSSSESVESSSAPVGLQMQTLIPAVGQPAVPASLPSISSSPAVVEPISVVQKNSWKSGSPQNFVKELWPYAQKAARDLGTQPEALIAQAALETGWGQHMIQGSDGRDSFNLFGIKADSGWRGDKVSTETVEFRDGLMRKERAHFRAYGSFAESFSDYTDFLKSNPRYSEALYQARDGSDFSQALADAGYATDPEYSVKINAIMRGDRMQNVLSAIRGKPEEPLF